MSSRVLIPVLCVGAVAFACGPRTRDDASVRQSGTALAAANSDRASAPTNKSNAQRASAAPVQAELYVRAHESAIRLALYVENTSKKSIELTFPTGQTHDFVILDTLGREMWRWGRGRMFTQTLKNRPIGRGESISIEETWRTASLAPGTYIARATLKSKNYPIEQQTRFTVHGTRVAAR